MNLGKFLANTLITRREDARQETLPNIHRDVDERYDALTQFELGTYATKENARRSRKEIYTLWETMQQDPQVGEALGLQVTAALGGHETNGDVIFITPHERVRGKGSRAKALREKVEREAKLITPLLNQNAFMLSRQAIGYGDSYARIYTYKRDGVVDLMNSEHTAPPLIQSFEQGGRTIGFFCLEMDNWTKVVSKLTPNELLRMKMPRIIPVPQTPMAEWLKTIMLEYDIQTNMPIVPSAVGGSFLYQVEEPWKKVMQNLLAMNNQQIADSVKQTFLTVNMEGMPPNQQKKYKQGLVKMLQGYRDRVKAAFDGGEEIYATNYHIVPTWGDKQTINSLGDLGGGRQMPLNTEVLMINLRRLAGGLGTDLSLIGWADMLAGGLGDGAAFHTSAQIMRRSTWIRQSLIDSYDKLMAQHWAIKYNEYFKDGDYPWQFDFYSDQSAAATEALTNKQTRLNTTMIKAQTLQLLRDLGFSEATLQTMIEKDMGEDFDTAKKIANDLVRARETVADDGHGGAHGAEPTDSQPRDEPNNSSDESQDDSIYMGGDNEDY